MYRDPGPGKVGYPLRSCWLSLAHYQTLRRRTRSSAPTPEDISATLANKVTAPASGGPPVLGNAVAVAVVVAVAVAVAVAVGLAVAVAVGLAMPPP